ncbi:ABC transporter ATP-binding protein [Billgrantia gudaonensis]|uniref:Branched-chain amino acid transport system ATP-binding protein n=1 Tax=Billgrantia gudaonensis TaxID=376427 RepID=A0A1G8PNQ0_9GAMM|nr:ABC transporter ATP-binding protein [Halomonas gudaonensis]SDI93928.1 branched-chain amino acid transport system ATP-binding protein [Halomonas gudaonensis]
MTETMIRVECLEAHYGLGQALHDLDMHVGKECVAVMGRNGVGKTTLARVLMGLDPPQATGSVELLGQSVLGWPPYRIARLGVGYVPQGRRLFPSLSVDEHLQLNSRKGPTGEHWSTSRVFELFPSLGRRRKAYGDQISGGERSMLAIGRALVTNPGCLILDEPTEGLAPAVVEDVALSLKELSREGVAVLLIEQNVRAATLAADRAYFMSEGRIVHETVDGESMSDEATLGRYLGVSV